MVLNKLQKLLSVGAVALCVSFAASEGWSAVYVTGSGTPFPVTAQATVNNSINVTISTPLALGQIGAFGDAADTAQMVMTPAGAVTDDTVGASKLIHSSGTGTPGVVDITGAFFNTDITVGMDTPVDLTCGACADPAIFTLTDVTTDLTTPGSFLVDAVGTTDGAGALTINYGMTIDTQLLVATETYQNGVYAGGFDFTFSY